MEKVMLVDLPLHKDVVGHETAHQINLRQLVNALIVWQIFRLLIIILWCFTLGADTVSLGSGVSQAVRKVPGIDQFALELIELATKMQESSAAKIAVPLYGRADEPIALVSIARTLMAQRRARTQFMPPSLFHEPAWDILLNLFIAQEEGRTLNVKHLVQLIDTAVTTSQRWIDQLVHMHLVDRITDPDDRRKLEVTLSDKGRGMLVPYLQSLVAGEGPAPGPL